MTIRHFPFRISKRFTHYATLGIGNHASPNEIKTAYRSLSLKWHPDIAGDSEETKKKWREILSAYETLSDENKRRQYDREINPPEFDNVNIEQARLFRQRK